MKRIADLCFLILLCALMIPGCQGFPGDSDSESYEKTPTTITNGATDISSTSARLNGTIDPKHEATTCYFEYGTTTAYGKNTYPAGFHGVDPDTVYAVIDPRMAPGIAGGKSS